MNEENVQAAEALFERGRLLLMNNRPADAERFLRECLSQDPTNVIALNLLAICVQSVPDRKKEALKIIDGAVGLAPEWDELHTRRSLILTDLHRVKEARAAAETAIRLAPDESGPRAARALTFLEESRWPEAEAGAREALSFDADDTMAQNILSQSLVFQKKTAASQEDVAARLARNPEDSFTHYNAGYAALRAGDPRKAEVHFLESLRLDPTFDAAREGLLESFRARNAFYRGYLKYAFAMASFSERMRTVLVIGIYVVYRVGQSVLGAISPALATGLGLLYFLFVTWTYVARGVGNLFVLIDSRARSALLGRQKIEGVLVGGGVLVGLGFLVASLAMQSFVFALIGGAFMVPAIPIGLFLNAKGLGFRLLYGALGAVVILAAFTILTAIILPQYMTMDLFRNALRIGSYALFATTIVAAFGPRDN